MALFTKDERGRVLRRRRRKFAWRRSRLRRAAAPKAWMSWPASCAGGARRLVWPL